MGYRRIHTPSAWTGVEGSKKQKKRGARRRPPKSSGARGGRRSIDLWKRNRHEDLVLAGHVAVLRAAGCSRRLEVEAPVVEIPVVAAVDRLVAGAVGRIEVAAVVEAVDRADAGNLDVRSQRIVVIVEVDRHVPGRAGRVAGGEEFFDRDSTAQGAGQADARVAVAAVGDDAVQSASHELTRELPAGVTLDRDADRLERRVDVAGVRVGDLAAADVQIRVVDVVPRGDERSRDVDAAFLLRPRMGSPEPRRAADLVARLALGRQRIDRVADAGRLGAHGADGIGTDHVGSGVAETRRRNTGFRAVADVAVVVAGHRVVGLVTRSGAVAARGRAGVAVRVAAGGAVGQVGVLTEPVRRVAGRDSVANVAVVGADRRDVPLVTRSGAVAARGRAGVAVRVAAGGAVGRVGSVVARVDGFVAELRAVADVTVGGAIDRRSRAASALEVGGRRELGIAGGRGAAAGSAAAGVDDGDRRLVAQRIRVGRLDRVVVGPELDRLARVQRAGLGAAQVRAGVAARSGSAGSRGHQDVAGARRRAGAAGDGVACLGDGEVVAVANRVRKSDRAVNDVAARRGLGGALLDAVAEQAVAAVRVARAAVLRRDARLEDRDAVVARCAGNSRLGRRRQEHERPDDHERYARTSQNRPQVFLHFSLHVRWVSEALAGTNSLLMAHSLLLQLAK